jgi:hypothetical protein
VRIVQFQLMEAQLEFLLHLRGTTHQVLSLHLVVRVWRVMGGDLQCPTQGVRVGDHQHLQPHLKLPLLLGM